MEYARLGRTDISVSRVCLGTMTFGQQNTVEDACWQLDRARDAGVTFIDMAELYPVPARPETSGKTEAFVGEWLRTRRRDDVVIATKIAGPGVGHIRDGQSRFDARHIGEALDASLRRLGTDYIDLYQLHWPERKTNVFGRRGYERARDDDFTPIDEVLAALDTVIRAGKVRAIGVSNETPWGLNVYLNGADRLALPRVASIQNPYSLLNRLFEVGLSEIALRDGCGLLAYSPMAFGVLSGKYLNGTPPPDARLTLFPEYTRYVTPNARKATAAYVRLARDHGLEPAQMALAFVIGRPFVTSMIIGARTPEQLEQNLAAAEQTLSDDVIAGINHIHEDIPDPAP
jgi:aryl-alcohol dehydrogenase-like predicted oxidoreductase